MAQTKPRHVALRLGALLGLLMLCPLCAHAQASYIVEQIGRDAHHIVQSLGAFVGNEQAESQSFDITYMPAGNRVEGVLIINTADYRVTFKTDPLQDVCFEIKLDIRSADFQREFNRLFQVYKTDNPDGEVKVMHFGDKLLRVEEEASRSTRYRAFTITQQ